MNAWPAVQRDEKSAAFFDAAARTELVVKRCRACGQLLDLEAAACNACAGADVEWTPVAGTGRLVSWTVVHRPPNPAFAELVPYTLGLVELTEGPWIYTRIEGAGAGQLHAGLAVWAQFVHPDGAESYPVFVP